MITDVYALSDDQRLAIGDLCRRFEVSRLDMCDPDPLFLEDEFDVLMIAEFPLTPARSGYDQFRVADELSRLMCARVCLRTWHAPDPTHGFRMPTLSVRIFPDATN